MLLMEWINDTYRGLWGLRGAWRFLLLLKEKKIRKKRRHVQCTWMTASLAIIFLPPNLEEDLVEEVDNGSCEAKVQPGGGELSPSPLHLLDLLRCI